MTTKSRFLVSCVLTLFACRSVSAQTIILENTTGDVRVSQPGQAAVAVANGARVQPSSTILTGPDGRTVLHFEDGQKAALANNSSLRVASYVFNPAQPEQGRSVIDFLRGGMRFVTGLVGKADHSRVQLRASQATIGIRGTDLVMVNGPNGLNVTVNEGGISASNSAGAGNADAGQGLTVTDAGSAPTPSSITSLPGSVQGTIGDLNGLDLTGAAAPAAGAEGSAGAGAASGAAVGGIGAGAIAAGVVAAGALVGASANKGTNNSNGGTGGTAGSGGTSGTSGTSGTTGTH